MAAEEASARRAWRVQNPRGSSVGGNDQEKVSNGRSRSQEKNGQEEHGQEEAHGSGTSAGRAGWNREVRGERHCEGRDGPRQARRAGTGEISAGNGRRVSGDE